MAGKIPSTFIDELMTRADIVDVIDPARAAHPKGQGIPGLLSVPR